MNTTTAAQAAGVTVATVRTWCRAGAVTAVKVSGRWDIDADSLTWRINLAKELTVKTQPKKVTFTVENITAIGGSRWTKAGKDRVYLNGWAALAGLETDNYKTGNISAATWQGEGISNSQAYKILGSIDRVWYDTADGKLHCRWGLTESRVASRQEVWAAVVAGVRAAIAAL